MSATTYLSNLTLPALAEIGNEASQPSFFPPHMLAIYNLHRKEQQGAIECLMK